MMKRFATLLVAFTLVIGLGAGAEGIKLFGNAQLDMNGKSMTNFFGSACTGNDVVQDIQDDGTIVCTTVDTSVADIWVNESGDTMTGNLDMGVNDITRAENIKAFTNIETGTRYSLDGRTIIEEFVGTTNARGDWEFSSGNSGSASVVFDDGATFNSIVNMNSNVIANVTDPTNAQDAATKSYVDAADISLADVEAEFVNQSGDTMSGVLDMQGNNIVFNTGAPTPAEVGPSGFQTEQGADYTASGIQTAIGSFNFNQGFGFFTMGNDLSMEGNQITGLADPTGSQHAATKSYVDAADISLADVEASFVNQSGDTMSGDLNMGGNYLDNAGRVQTNNLLSAHGAEIEVANGLELSGNLKFEHFSPGMDITFSNGRLKFHDQAADNNGVSYIEFDSENRTLDMVGNNIVNVADPTNPQDAATKSYVDANAGSSGTPVSYDTGHTAWGNLTNEEINRYVVGSGETFTLERLAFHAKGGGAEDAGKTVELAYANGTVIDSVNLNAVSTVGATVSGASDLVVQMTTDGSVDASVRMSGNIQ